MGRNSCELLSPPLKTGSYRYKRLYVYNDRFRALQSVGTIFLRFTSREVILIDLRLFFAYAQTRGLHETAGQARGRGGTCQRLPVWPCQAPSGMAPDATAPRMAGVLHRGPMRVRLLIFLSMQAHRVTAWQWNLRGHTAKAQMQSLQSPTGRNVPRCRTPSDLRLWWTRSRLVSAHPLALTHRRAVGPRRR